jgi:hypothetical protein
MVFVEPIDELVDPARDLENDWQRRVDASPQRDGVPCQIESFPFAWQKIGHKHGTMERVLTRQTRYTYPSAGIVSNNTKQNASERRIKPTSFIYERHFEGEKVVV